MRAAFVLVLCFISTVAWGKKPSEEPPKQEKKEEKKQVVPDKISDADRHELMMLEATRQVMELRKQILLLQSQLLECQAPQSEKQIGERRKKLLDLYKLTDGDTVKDDGTIVRKKVRPRLVHEEPDKGP